MLFKLLIPFFLILNIFAEDNITTAEIKPEPISKNLYLSYDQVPEQIYKNQQFEITLKAIITTPLWDRIDTNFNIQDANFKLYDKSPGWKWVEDNTYYNKYYLKANNKVDELPQITISIYNEDFELLEQAITPKKKINYKDILGDDKYSNVVASNLRVVSSSTKQYNNQTLMSVIELEGTKSNLEDFYLKAFEQQGTQTFEDKADKQKLIYYIMVPIYKNKIDFNYYNFTKKRFENLEIAIVLEEDLVSTQTDLNPGSSSLLVYKQIAILGLLLVLLIVYYFKRLKVVLLGIVVLIVVFGFTFIPNSTATLKARSNVYILPTKNSTLFEITTRKKKVEVLTQKDEYIKILLPNKTIGWVKEDDIIKN